MKTPHPRLPDFLVIGAQKCGTTSLYWDLLAHPDIVFPLDKEPGCLASDDVLSESGRRRYGDLYRRALAHQRCGDASTDYSKLPEIGGVPERALRVLGPELRIVYLVRDPVQRILSQHRHELAEGRVGPKVNEVVRREARYLDTSRYAMQIEAWKRHLPSDRILVVPFSRYVEDRSEIVVEISRFLGLAPPPESVSDEVYNASEDRRHLGRWRGVRDSKLYRRLRPWLSPSVRRRLRRILLPTVKVQADPLEPSTLHYLVDSLREDLELQPAAFGTETPFWTADEILDRALNR